jgi:hypothetical protein
MDIDSAPVGENARETRAARRKGSGRTGRGEWSSNKLLSNKQ